MRYFGGGVGHLSNVDSTAHWRRAPREADEAEDDDDGGNLHLDEDAEEESDEEVDFVESGDDTGDAEAEEDRLEDDDDF